MSKSRSGCCGEETFFLSWLSKTSVMFQGQPGSSSSPSSIVCNKKNQPPNSPSSLTYANSSSSITLTWTDNNSEEVTGYKVLRKTVVTDDFTTVSTITDNSIRTYADTNVSTGTYWYRVRAYNGNGDGIPSKVVNVEFP